MSEQQKKIPRVLVVDDETSVLNALQRVFHDEPYDVLTASGAVSALEILQETGHIQLIISDYRMPGINGIEFLQQVMQQWPDTRRVILSAFPDTDVLLAALNEGRAHRFLVKPWNNESIKAVVREMLDEYAVLVDFRQGAEELARNNRLLSRTNEHLSSMLADVLATMRQQTAYENPVPYAQRPALPADTKRHESLSSREREILNAIASGHSLKAIAMDLDLSIKTVSTYKKRLCDKMGFKNDAELIGYTLKNDLLPPPRL